MPSIQRMSKVWWSIAVLAVFVAGCNPPKKNEVASKAGEPGSSTTAPEAPKDSPLEMSEVPGQPPTTPSTPGAAPGTTAPKPPPEIKIKPEVFKPTESGTKGWVVTNQADLGVQVDQGLMEARELLGVAQFLYQAPVGKMTAKPSIKIRDDKKFRIEYFLPKTQGSINILIGDGTTAKRYEGSKWSTVAAVRAMPSLDDAGTNEWIDNFPTAMFSGFGSGRPTWTNLVNALREGKAGYKATTETRTVTSKGRTATFMRIRAERSSPKSTFEAVVDQEFRLPVTVRLDAVNEKGEPYQILWTCKWSKGGSHKDSDFVVPTVTEK